MNPYLVVERNGAVEPLYTVFEVTVHNLDSPRVQVADDAAVLIDKNGAQHAALPYDYFERLYDDVDISRGEVTAASRLSLRLFALLSLRLRALLSFVLSLLFLR